MFILVRSSNSHCIPINKLLDAGVAPQEIPLPHEFLINRELMSQLYPSFSKGLAPFSVVIGRIFRFFNIQRWIKPCYRWFMVDIAHHHLALSVLFILLVICTVLIGVLVIV
jgi:photosystem I P700 chlorophyll a apoprotein A1